MLVDDERALIEEIAEELRAEGIEVWLATDGVEAFSLAERHLPPTVVVDKNMPGISGLGLVRNLRSLPGGSSLHILMISAFFSPEERAEGLRLGVDRFLEKPFDLDQVVDWIGEKLDIGRAPSSIAPPAAAPLEERVAHLETLVARLDRELHDCRERLNRSAGLRRDPDHG